MNGATFLYALAVHIAWMDAKGYGVNSQLAILFCLRNRIAAGWENGDLGRIIQSYYFHPLHLEAYIPEIPDVRDPEFTQVLGYVESIFDNSAQDRLTNGALFWGVEKPLGAKERVAQVGTMLFWK